MTVWMTADLTMSERRKSSPEFRAAGQYRPSGRFAGGFDSLSGGQSTTQDDGTQVAPNGVRHRPGDDVQGPRIDIPANGSRPPETIHFPLGG